MEAARQHRVTVICGMNERDEEHGSGTLCNAVVVIGVTPESAPQADADKPGEDDMGPWGRLLAPGSRHAVRATGNTDLLENFMPLARKSLHA